MSPPPNGRRKSVASIKLFGVALTHTSGVSSSSSSSTTSSCMSAVIRKSMSMNSLVSSSWLPLPLAPPHSPCFGNGYVSDHLIHIPRDRKKGVPWTEDEHRLFLVGLQKLGKGDWRGISRSFVKTRTPTQVASHAQKYFLRKNNLNKRRRRSSLFDIAPVFEEHGYYEELIAEEEEEEERAGEGEAGLCSSAIALQGRQNFTLPISDLPASLCFPSQTEKENCEAVMDSCSRWSSLAISKNVPLYSVTHSPSLPPLLPFFPMWAKSTSTLTSASKLVKPTPISGAQALELRGVTTTVMDSPRPPVLLMQPSALSYKLLEEQTPRHSAFHFMPPAPTVDLDSQGTLNTSAISVA